MFPEMGEQSVSHGRQQVRVVVCLFYGINYPSPRGRGWPSVAVATEAG